jgi:hypothetical protein
MLGAFEASVAITKDETAMRELLEKRLENKSIAAPKINDNAVTSSTESRLNYIRSTNKKTITENGEGD